MESLVKSAFENPMWKCADPSCHKVNSGIDPSCVKCNLLRAKSDSHQQKVQFGKEKTGRRSTDKEAGRVGNFTRIVGRGGSTHVIGRGRADVIKIFGEIEHIGKGRAVRVSQRRGNTKVGKGIPQNTRENVPLGQDGRIFSEDSKESSSKNPRTAVSPSPTYSMKELVDNGSINHRLSSILCRYSSAIISRDERKENLTGVKYVLEVSFKTDIENLTKALNRVEKIKAMEKVENEKGALKYLGVQLIQTLGAVNWTKLASLYKNSSVMSNVSSRMKVEDVLATLSLNHEKEKKLERRVNKLKRYLNGIVLTLVNIEEGKGVDKVPDIEESLRKVEECLDQPALQNMDDEMITWAKLKIEEVLDDVSSAWEEVGCDSEMNMRLKKTDNPLELFAGKYCLQGVSKNNNYEDENRRDSKVDKTVVDNDEPGKKPNLSLSVEASSENENEFEKLTEAREVISVKAAVVSEKAKVTKVDVQEWSAKDLNENISTPNTSVLVGTEDFYTPESEKGGFYSSEETSEEFHSPKDKFDTQNHTRTDSTEKLKSTETGFIQVEELKMLVETYTNQPTSLQIDHLLNLLDRDQDGWILYEEFEASLTSDLLSSGW